MKRKARILSLITALLSALTLARRVGRPDGALLWIPKLLASALTPLLAVVGGFSALLSLRRRDALSALAGMVGAALSLRYARRASAPHDRFEEAFGPDWPSRIPTMLRPHLLSKRWMPVLCPPPARWQRNVAFATSPASGQPLLADIWEPPAGVLRTGLAVIYVHGGAWRIGTKDLGTRTLFRCLAGQGHVVMDISYTMAPYATMPEMVADVKRAVIWLKQNSGRYGVNPARIVLMGGSAGGHLALLAAYTPNDPLFQPAESDVDTSVRAVVSFYGPPDLRAVYDDVARAYDELRTARQALLYRWLLGRLLHVAGLLPGSRIYQAEHFMVTLLGATPDENPELYRRLSPITYASADCPPTLQLQGTADFFAIGRVVPHLHQALCQAGATSVLVEFPDTDHAFDLILPRISPVAQSAIHDVERFLALMV